MLIKMKNGESIRIDNNIAFATMDLERIKVERRVTKELVFWALIESIEYWIKEENEEEGRIAIECQVFT